MKLRMIRDANIKKGTRVIVRADFDVTLKNNRIEDDFRIRQVRETLRFIADRGASVRIVSHLGRPGGKAVLALSLKKLLPFVSGELGSDFIFIKDPFDKCVKDQFLHSAQHLFFENIRFWPGEEKNDKTFAEKLAEWGDIYVNEAFAVSHRPHASVVLLPALIPAFAGFHFAKEAEMLLRVLASTERPLVAVLGGEKIETKLALVEYFLKKWDAVLVGGTLMNTLLASRGIAVGNSPVDLGFINNPNRFVLRHQNLILPCDAIVGKSVHAKPRVARVEHIAADETIFDIGPESIKEFSHIIAGARTLIWNGPLGQAELKQFAGGTIAVAKQIQQIKGLTVVGGGHTVSALHAYGLTKNITHISTGGGAMLEFLAGKKLPGVEALKK